MAKASGKAGGKMARGRKSDLRSGEDAAAEMFQTYADRTVTVTTTMRVRRSSMGGGSIEYHAQRTRIEMAIDDGVLPGTKAKVLDFEIEGPSSGSYDSVDGAMSEVLAGANRFLMELSIQKAADKSAFRDAARGRERKVRP